MQRGPFVIAAGAVASAVGWSLHLAAVDRPFAGDAALVIAIGLLGYAAIAVAGLLLARGRWATWMVAGVVAAGLVLAVVTSPTAWYWVGLVTGAAVLAALRGPWLHGWIRQLPGADGPPPAAMAIPLLAFGLVPAVGIASPSGLAPGHGILGAAGLLLAWAYGRAQTWSLWALRLVLLPVAIPAILAGPPAGSALLAALTGVTVALAWTAPARLAVEPLTDHIPGPRIAKPKEAP